MTASGRHIPFGVPGDVLLEDGALAPGAHHQAPPCSLFPTCGGCQLQHVDDDAYRDFLVNRISGGLAQHGIETKVHEPYLSPPFSRRRATLRAIKAGSSVLIGFNAQKSHRIVDMDECHILRPELFSLVEPLRALLDPLLRQGRSAELQLSLVDQGLDLLIRNVEANGLHELELLTSFSKANGLARLSLDDGLGNQTIYEPERVTVTLSKTVVEFPVGAFLQATSDGEKVLIDCVRQSLGGSTAIADLFAGLGTFALGVGARYAAEASRASALALANAAPRAHVEHRDLYRSPLGPEELKAFDSIILDPPRAGAEAQVRMLARSKLSTIAYVSCNPATFARDSKILIDKGYRLDWVRPVGQFRWSTHIELAASFCFTG